MCKSTTRPFPGIRTFSLYRACSPGLHLSLRLSLPSPALSLRPSSPSPCPPPPSLARTLFPLISSTVYFPHVRLDLSDMGVDDAQCGACWAFATIGVTEAINALYTGEFVSLSEQQLIDCDRGAPFDDNGCHAGW
jgi:hypothetical protein